MCIRDRYGCLLTSFIDGGSTIFDIVSDFLTSLEFLGSTTNQTIVDPIPKSDTGETHQIWGIVSIALIFLPGAALFIPSTLDILDRCRNSRLANLSPLLATSLILIQVCLYPFLNILVHCMYIFVLTIAAVRDKVHQTSADREKKGKNGKENKNVEKTKTSEKKQKEQTMQKEQKN